MDKIIRHLKIFPKPITLLSRKFIIEDLFTFLKIQ